VCGGARFIAGKLTASFHFSVISYLMNLAGHREFDTFEDRARLAWAGWAFPSRMSLFTLVSCLV
jgi:hypothetical protein